LAGNQGVGRNRANWELHQEGVAAKGDLVVLSPLGCPLKLPHSKQAAVVWGKSLLVAEKAAILTPKRVEQQPVSFVATAPLPSFAHLDLVVVVI
jgi:hypothetical protein